MAKERGEAGIWRKSHEMSRDEKGWRRQRGRGRCRRGKKERTRKGGRRSKRRIENGLSL